MHASLCPLALGFSFLYRSSSLSVQIWYATRNSGTCKGEHRRDVTLSMRAQVRTRAGTYACMHVVHRSYFSILSSTGSQQQTA